MMYSIISLWKELDKSAKNKKFHLSQIKQIIEENSIGLFNKFLSKKKVTLYVLTVNFTRFPSGTV
jgi:hypothetical protein